jgi:primary-amine oxidase
MRQSQQVRVTRCWLVAFALATLLASGAQLFAATHPLDPLTKDEIRTAMKVLRASGKVDAETRFPVIALQEPDKGEVLAYKVENPISRKAFIVVYERGTSTTSEAVVDCTHSTLVSWKKMPGVQPPFTEEDIKLTQEIVHADPQWQAAMHKRGITDFEHIQVDPWSAGFYRLPGEDSIRVIRALSYYNAGSVNPYARPIEGVAVYINMNERKVFTVVDSGVVPVPKATADFDDKSVGPLRAPPKPLQVSLPEGPSYEIRDGEVIWQNWHFRFGRHPREGLVLYTVGYEDHGRVRPILYRAALSEMIVPYGDPGPAWFFRNAFDEGEYGIGHMTYPEEPGTDAPPDAQFFSALFADERGEPFEIPRAVALYERDGGLLWKHVDEKTEINQSRRARELVLQWIATVGNYEYGFNWVFHQDGTLQMDVVLTGIMEPKALAAAGQHDAYGHLVAPDIEAVHHQHFFNFRLDLDVDGARDNSVVEMNTVPLPPGKENPYENAFVAREQVLRTEQDGMRNLNMQTARVWKVINRSSRNAVGQPVGYALVPEENAVPYASAESSMRKRAGFLNAQLWVTPYDPAERYAAGDYVSQSQGGDGLVRWVKANRPIDGKDVVLWYTLGVTHVPRPEDWPVMPVVHTGFKLVPTGFFDRNPGLDLPATKLDLKTVKAANGHRQD